MAQGPTGNTLFTDGEIVVCVQTFRMMQTVQNQPSCPLSESGESRLKLAPHADEEQANALKLKLIFRCCLKKTAGVSF